MNREIRQARIRMGSGMFVVDRQDPVGFGLTNMPLCVSIHRSAFGLDRGVAEDTGSCVRIPMIGW